MSRSADADIFGLTKSEKFGYLAPMDAHSLMKALGKSETAAALGVSEKTVADHMTRGVFPAAWFSVIRDKSHEKGVACPESLFSFKRGQAA